MSFVGFTLHDSGITLHGFGLPLHGFGLALLGFGLTLHAFGLTLHAFCPTLHAFGMTLHGLGMTLPRDPQRARGAFFGAEGALYYPIFAKASDRAGALARKGRGLRLQELRPRDAGRQPRARRQGSGGRQGISCGICVPFFGTYQGRVSSRLRLVGLSRKRPPLEPVAGRGAVWWAPKRKQIANDRAAAGAGLDGHPSKGCRP